jgi:hypothetical protein
MMWNLQIKMQCFDRFLEVLPDEMESTELSVECGVSQVLLALFQEVIMGEVRIYFSPDPWIGLNRYSIQVGAECDRQYFSSFSQAGEHVKRAIAQNVSTIMKELFGMVNVESITMLPSMSNCGNGSAFYCI